MCSYFYLVSNVWAHFDLFLLFLWKRFLLKKRFHAKNMFVTIARGNCPGERRWCLRASGTTEGPQDTCTHVCSAQVKSQALGRARLRQRQELLACISRSLHRCSVFQSLPKCFLWWAQSGLSHNSNCPLLPSEYQHPPTGPSWLVTKP